MERVLVVCEAGITTSLLVKKLKELAAEEGLEADIQSKSLEVGLDYIKENPVDVILLGPQIHHIKSKYENATNAKIAKISVDDYNTMNVYSIFEQINEA